MATNPPSENEVIESRITSCGTAAAFHAEHEKINVSPQASYAVDVFTGIRPTGALTVGNYVGAVQPTIRLLESGLQTVVFVADLHGLTTHEPREIAEYTNEVIVDYLALGLDPERCQIFVQSAIAPEIFELTSYLSRHISLAEIMRVPTLKDKVGPGSDEASASLFLASYPVMMAADILLQRAHFVPVGQDQVSHLEVTNRLAQRFNNRYGAVFPLPEAQITENAAKILGLQGSGKMGKSAPNEAIFLTDAPDEIAKKVKNAKTAFAGEMNEVLESHINLIRALGGDRVSAALEELVLRHLSGEKVMGEFKRLMTETLVTFVDVFRTNRERLCNDPGFIEQVVANGNETARQIARETLSNVRNAMRGEGK